MSTNKRFLDDSGVTYLYKQLSLQDYPNNQTLMSVITAIDETKANKNFETWTFTLANGTTVTKQVNIND